MHFLNIQKKLVIVGLFLYFLTFLFLIFPNLTIQAKTVKLIRTSFCMWGGGGGAEPLKLYENPQERLINRPTREGVLYGTLPYGNSDDPVSFAYKERFGKSPLIWIDSNNDEDLRNDSTPTPELAPTGWRTFTYLKRIEAKYVDSGSSRYVKVPILINAVPRKDEKSSWDLVPSMSGTRRGMIEVDGEKYKIALADGNWDGLFTPDNVIAFIDSDGDGEICPRCIHEIYPPGETIWIKDNSYRVASVSPSGRKIRLEPVDEEPSSRPFILTPGRKMRDFRIHTFNDKSFSLSSLRGELAVLNFVPTLSQFRPEKSVRKLQRNRLKERVKFVEENLSEKKYKDVRFQLITLEPGYQPTKEKASEFSRWKIGWSPQLSEPRPTIGRSLVILNEEGIIRYTDEWIIQWDYLGCKIPESRLATGPQIKWALDRLLNNK